MSKTKSISRRTIHGLGTLIQRGSYWHLEFTVNGERYRESANSENYNDAVKQLKKRIGEVHTGRFAGVEIEKIPMGELLADVLDDYRTRHPRSVDGFAEPIINNHLLPWFGKARATNVGTSVIRAYIKERLKDGAAKATVNRELSLLRRAFSLGKQQTPPKVHNMPTFKGLLFEENNARKGFYERGDFERMRDHLPADERAVFVAGYYTLMRYTALVMMEWSWVNLEAQTISIPPGVLKNSEPLTVPTGGPGDEFYDMLATRKALHTLVCPATLWVFFRSENRGNRGKSTRQVGNQVLCIRHLLDAARTELGMQSRLFHDLRRTGARNLRKAGVPESVIMKLGGWKTNSVFRRYNIMDETDLHDATKKLNQYLKGVA